MEIRKLMLTLALITPIAATYAGGLPGDAMDMAKEAAAKKAEGIKDDAAEAATDKAETEDSKEGIMDKAKDKAMEMGGKLMGK